jgi:L-threonylcarbamoyladenylate synthase
MTEDIKKALEVLKGGGVILYPTDTIWGIGCDATNPEAVSKVYKIKQREDSKSMLVLMENPNLITSYIDEMPEVAWDLIDVAEKPLTIIYPGAKNLAPNLVASDKSIGIRITSEKFTQNLIQRFRKPIVSTSANISGQPAPANFDEISEEVKSQVDYIVNYRQDDITKATSSGIIKLGVGGEIQIIRK